MDQIQLTELFGLASSQNVDQITLAESKLKLLGNSHGFFLATSKIILDKNSTIPARFQAALFLKNAIDSLWRKPKAENQFFLSDEEKSAIKAELLSRFDEECDQINIQIAAIISKIARIDCPQNWPKLIPQLSEAIFYRSGAESLIHNRALCVLFQVVKALVSKRLAPDKRLFSELSASVFPSLAALWLAHFQEFSQPANQKAAAHAANGLICIKILRYVVNFGFGSHYEQKPDLKVFIDQSPIWAGHIFELALTEHFAQKDAKLVDYLFRILKSILKMTMEFQSMHILNFVNWMRPWLDNCVKFAFNDRIYNVDVPKIKLNSINLMKIILMSEDYKSREDGPESTASAIRREFFSPENVQKICFNLIKHYLIVNDELLARWENDAESFAITDDSHTWKEYLPAAANSFYTALVHECWPNLKEVMKNWFSHIAQPIDFSNRDQVLEKEALMTALGLAASDLYDDIDFDALFVNMFIPALQSSPSGQNSKYENLMRRRVLWLCGQWVNVKMSIEQRDQLYRLLIGNMKPDYDIVIRLAACQAFRTSVDDFEFKIDHFRPYISSSVDALVELLKVCTESDTQIVVVTTLWLLTEQVGSEMKSYLESIITYTATLWDTDNNMLKCHILTLFKLIVKVLKRDCLCVMEGLCSILPTALDTSQSLHFYLVEDGVDLWLALIECTPTPLPKCLLDLAQFLPEIIVNQTENLLVCCEVAKVYCITLSEEFAQIWLVKFCQRAILALSDMKYEGQRALLRAIETALKCYKSSGVVFCSSAIDWCLNVLLNERQEIASVAMVTVSILSLVSMYNTPALMEMIKRKGSNYQTFLSNMLENFVFTVQDLERRKIFGLGLCAWLAQPDILSINDVIPKVLTALSEILGDLCSKKAGDSGIIDTMVLQDSQELDPNNYDMSFADEEHDKRSLLLRQCDPVYTVHFHNTVREALRLYKMNCGSEMAFETIWRLLEDNVRNDLEFYVR